MAIKLQLRGIQQITITPVMHYFLELLVSGRVELIDRIQGEVDSNPMLEIESGESGTDATPAEESDDENAFSQRLERADSSFLTPYEDQGFFRKTSDESDKSRALEALTPSKVTLADYLLSQAQAVLGDESELEIVRQIVYNLDNNGYLKLEIESIASLIGATPERIDEIRRQVMAFDPPGCGAKTLPECLLAQLEESSGDGKLRQLISHHLEDVSKSRFDVIAKGLGISLEEVFDLISRVRRLNPHPAEAFAGEETEYAEVDLMLIKEGNEYRVVFIDEGIPRLQLSHYYQQMLEKTKDRKTVSFLKGRCRDAQFFIESIELRKKTIVRIAEYIVQVQKDFLDFGEKWKKPLTMKEVARAVNLNESTISRSVSNKFIATEKGLVSLKSFFGYGLKGDFGFTHSVETIKDKIREIIAAEPAANPIADDEIARQLADLGIRIARRTVRNYREEMKIPSSFVRKKTQHLKKETTNEHQL